jgi:hypothetical protein
VFVCSGGVRLSPLGTSANIWPIVPAPYDDWWWMWSSRWNECQRNRNTPRNLPQWRFVHHKPHITRLGLEPGQSRWQLTAWATARPFKCTYTIGLIYYIETSVRNKCRCSFLLCTFYTTCFGPYWWPSSADIYSNCLRIFCITNHLKMATNMGRNI